MTPTRLIECAIIVNEALSDGKNPEAMGAFMELVEEMDARGKRLQSMRSDAREGGET